MKISRILPSLTGIALVSVMLGCNDLGSQLAKILPSTDDSAQLSEADDAAAIDPSQRGGGNTSMAQPGANESAGVNGFSDGPMNEDYSEMIGNFENDMAMEGMEDGGTLMGFDDEQQMMQMDDPTGGFEGGADTDMTAQMNMLEPANLGGGDGTPGYLESLGGGMFEPPLDDFGGEQSLGGFGGGVGGMKKPENGRGPQKRLPAKTTQSGTPNIRDRPSKSSGNKPIGASNNPPKPAMRPNSQNPSTGKPTTKPNVPAAGIRIPGNITSPAYSLINSVAVPILLQNGTRMSFSTEILQQRSLTSRGTVYWVVHSQRLGFIRFPVSPAGGRVSGVGSKFTPTSGPFKAFIVSVEANGEIKYLSSAANIQWNP
jgi:hypothetical protein